jgi:hypothetical protein
MSCDHTLDVSVLLDGELAPGETPALVAHLLACPTCAGFFRRAHALEGAVLLASAEAEAETDAGAVASPPPAVWERIVRATVTGPIATGERRLARLPRWATAAAAAALLALGGLLGWQLAGRSRSAAEPQRLPSREAVTLAALGTPPAMDEDRFVALARELLAADPRFHDAMAGVLAVARSGAPRESSTAESAWRYEELRGLEEPARLH